MKNDQEFVELALRAARRAARKVREKARLEGTPIPFWDGTRVQMKVPEFNNEVQTDNKPSRR
jgi:hypothetical protein